MSKEYSYLNLIQHDTGIEFDISPMPIPPMLGSDTDKFIARYKILGNPQTVMAMVTTPIVTHCKKNNWTPERSVKYARTKLRKNLFKGKTIELKPRVSMVPSLAQAIHEANDRANVVPFTKPKKAAKPKQLIGPIFDKAKEEALMWLVRSTWHARGRFQAMGQGAASKDNPIIYHGESRDRAFDSYCWRILGKAPTLKGKEGMYYRKAGKDEVIGVSIVLGQGLNVSKWQGLEMRDGEYVDEILMSSVFVVQTLKEMRSNIKQLTKRNKLGKSFHEFAIEHYLKEAKENSRKKFRYNSKTDFIEEEGTK